MSFDDIYKCNNCKFNQLVICLECKKYTRRRGRWCGLCYDCEEAQSTNTTNTPAISINEAEPAFVPETQYSLVYSDEPDNPVNTIGHSVSQLFGNPEYKPKRKWRVPPRKRKKSCTCVIV
jgi:hypothetical protein